MHQYRNVGAYYARLRCWAVGLTVLLVLVGIGAMIVGVLNMAAANAQKRFCFYDSDSNIYGYVVLDTAERTFSWEFKSPDATIAGIGMYPDLDLEVEGGNTPEPVILCDHTSCDQSSETGISMGLIDEQVHNGGETNRIAIETILANPTYYTLNITTTPSQLPPLILNRMTAQC